MKPLVCHYTQTWLASYLFHTTISLGATTTTNCISPLTSTEDGLWNRQPMKQPSTTKKTKSKAPRRLPNPGRFEATCEVVTQWNLLRYRQWRWGGPSPAGTMLVFICSRALIGFGWCYVSITSCQMAKKTGGRRKYRCRERWRRMGSTFQAFSIHQL